MAVEVQAVREVPVVLVVPAACLGVVGWAAVPQ